jgi:hypothetical protein
MRRLARGLAVLGVALLVTAPAAAQTAPATPDVHVHDAPTTDAWQWRVETNIVAGRIGSSRTSTRGSRRTG